MRTSIGHTEVKANGHTYQLYPTLKNIEKIGDGKKLMELFNLIHGIGHEKHVGSDWFTVHQVAQARNVIKACCEEDIDRILLRAKLVKDKIRPSFRPGGIDNPEVQIILASHLLRHGVAGVKLNNEDEEESSGDGEEVNSDSVDIYRALDCARVHLGRTDKEAWDMTMTEIVQMMEMKFPKPKEDPKKQKPPTNKEYDETMSWFEEVQKRRAN